MRATRRALWAVPAWALLAAAGVETVRRHRPAAAAPTWMSAPADALRLDPRAEQEARQLRKAMELDRAAAAAAQRRKDALTAALNSQLNRRIERAAVAVVDHRTGLTYGWRADEPFQTASIVKVEVLAATIMRAATQGRELTSTERSLAAPMIQLSDNAATDTLWRQMGGAQGLANTSRVLGLTATVAGTGWWGVTTTTASDQARLMGVVLGAGSPLPASGVAYLAQLMGSVNQRQDWGISAAARSREKVVLKNGWMPRGPNDTNWTVNSIGRIGGTNVDVTLVVLSSHNRDMAAGVAFVEQLARLARKHLAW